MRRTSGITVALSCGEVSALLLAYVDGEFDTAECGAVEAHLAGCAVCARLARLHGTFKQALRRAASLREPAPESLREAVLANLEGAGGEGRLEDDGLREPDASAPLLARVLHRLTPRTLALAAAAAGAGAWLIASGLQHPLLQADAQRGSFAEVSRAALEDGIAAHARPFPLDYSGSDVGSMQRWLAGKLEFGVRLPRFAHHDAPLLQGVRLSVLHARPAAIVSYSMAGAQRRVSLIISDDPQPRLPGVSHHLGGREVWVAQARGYNVASWKTNEIVYSLVSDMDEREVLELARVADQR